MRYAELFNRLRSSKPTDIEAKARQVTADYTIIDPTESVALVPSRFNNQKTGETFKEKTAAMVQRLGNELGLAVQNYTYAIDAEPIPTGALIDALCSEDEQMQKFAREVSQYMGSFPVINIPYHGNGELKPLPYQWRSIVRAKSEEVVRVNENKEVLSVILDVNFKDKSIYFVHGPLGKVANFQPRKEQENLHILGKISISYSDTQSHSLQSLIDSLFDQFSHLSQSAGITFDLEELQVAIIGLLTLPKSQIQARDKKIPDINQLIEKDKILLICQEYPQFVHPLLKRASDLSVNDLNTIPENWTPSSWQDITDQYGHSVNRQTSHILVESHETAEQYEENQRKLITKTAETDRNLLGLQHEVDVTAEEAFAQGQEANLLEQGLTSEQQRMQHKIQVDKLNDALDALTDGFNAYLESRIPKIAFENTKQASLAAQTLLDLTNSLVDGRIKDRLQQKLTSYIEDLNRLPEGEASLAIEFPNRGDFELAKNLFEKASQQYNLPPGSDL